MIETAKIYVDIESLLDVRQGILFQLRNDHDALTDYLLSDEYNFRKKDTFENIDPEAYQAILQAAEHETLKLSNITYILNVVKTKIANLEKRNAYYGERRVAEVILNTYPFVFTQAESEVLQNILFVKLNTEAMVSVVYMEPKDVSPFFMKMSNVITAIIYDSSTWFNLHTSSLHQQKLPDTLLYFPSLIKEEMTPEEQANFNKLGFKDPFSYFEFLFSGTVNVNFLPVVFYSNLITATGILSKFDDELRNRKLSSESDEEIKVDLSALDGL